MRFQGVHRVWPKSGWLLSYGLKGVSAAMVARLARFLMACNGGKYHLCIICFKSRKVVSIKNTDINNINIHMQIKNDVFEVP